MRLHSFPLILLLTISFETIQIKMIQVTAFMEKSIVPMSRQRFGTLRRKFYTPASAFNNILEGEKPDCSYWERLNSPQFVMAPMVAQSDLPFRRLCRNHGTDLCFTQMIHASNFVASESFQDAQLDVYRIDEEIMLSPSGVNALNGLEGSAYCDLQHHALSESCTSNGDIDSFRWNQYQEGRKENNPLIVQLAGHDSNLITEAALIILERTGQISGNQYTGPVSGIDINCGCPQGIARKGKYGAFLMEENEDTVCDIINSLKSSLPRNVGVSCKMRIPEDVGLPRGDAILKERVCKLIDAGVDLLTIHGRTLKENKTKVQECNWDAIAQVVKISKEYSGIADFPVIANGGIEFSSDVKRCLEYTGASAVMSSEALLENPGIFASNAMDDIHLSPKEIFQRQMMYCHQYLDLCILFPPIPGSLGKKGGSFNCIRSHLFKLMHRYLEEHPDLRTRMGHSTEMVSIQDARDLVYELERRYKTVEEWESLSSSKVTKSSWYRRHRDAKVNSKMHIRGQSIKSDLSDLTLSEKKKMLRERIKKLKEKRANIIV